MFRRLLICMAMGLVAAPLAAQQYLIEPGDVLSVTVIEDPSLNREVLVRPDGRINLPLAGSVEASGRTPETVQAAVRRALAREFVEAPSVTVALARLREQPLDEEVPLPAIFVLGAVNNPGRFEVSLPIDVLQALALSGGPGLFAATQRIQVRRRVEGIETVLLFDYRSVARGEALEEAIVLADGDVIVVPERGLLE